MKRIRLATATAGALTVALFFVAGALAKPPGPPTNVPCGGQSALVAAINAANSAGGGTLNLAKNCDYALTSVDNSGVNGLPVVVTKIAVNGNESTIDGTGVVRVFEVDGPSGNLSLNDVTITGGSASDPDGGIPTLVGGGIASFGGTVTLDHSQVSGNAAALAGGGIASATLDPSSPATLTLRNSSVNDNQQTVPASEDPDVMGGLGGGGIANLNGTAMLDHAQVNGNTAEGLSGGGIASGDFLGTGAPVLTVDHSQVNGNTGPLAGGGGIQNLLGTANVNHSQVDGNTSLNGGGIASGNQGGPGTAELNVSHSEVNGNTATAGTGGEGPPVAAGGIANGSEAVIDHSKVDDNSAPNGAGAGIVNHAMMTISHSEVNRNTAAASGAPGSGGGIFNATGPPGATPADVLNIDHSKIDDNSAGGWGGGIANGLPGSGPGDGGALTLTHSEVRHNNAAHGGGIFNRGGTVTLSDTKVTDNLVDNCESTSSIVGCVN
jgi:predicted outer membrane repeat protein